MKILIIEDEAPAARRLKELVKNNRPGAEILGPIDSVEQAAEWLMNNPAPDLAFMDIQLSDGLSFEIFENSVIKFPVIFTTAYDEYAIKAFKVNSIDYLLKPIDENELKNAFKKYDELNHAQPQPQMDIAQIVKAFKNDGYKTRFLIKQGQRLIPIDTADIAYFYAEEKVVFAVTADGRKYIIDYTLEQLENMLDPKAFFRANRKFITSGKSIKDIHISFNGKLKIYLSPDFAGEEIFVSRERAGEFKDWLN